MDNLHEEWRPVPDWEGLYEVSNLGRVRTCRRKIQRADGKPLCLPARVLRTSANGGDYIRVSLVGNGRKARTTVHALVAQAFLGPCPPKHEVNHKNGIKADNRPENLEYVTRLANMRHARRLGLITYGRVCNAKIQEGDVVAIRKRHADGESTQSLAEAYGLDRSTIKRITSRSSWRHVK